MTGRCANEAQRGNKHAAITPWIYLVVQR